MKHIFLSITILFSVISLLTSCGSKDRIEYFPFSDEDQERWGIVDAEGNVVVEKEWKNRPSVPFEGITKVKNKRGLYEYFAVSERPVQIGEEYSSASSFSEGLASVSEPDKPLSYINEKGEMAFDLDKSITHAGVFKDGLARIKTNEGKFGYINNKGKVVIDAIYEDASVFKEGLARVVDKDNGKLITCFINKAGERVISLDKAQTCNSDFSEGRVAVSEKGEFGYINKKGEYIIPVEKNRTYAGPFLDGYAVVGDGADYGIIDKTGKEVVRTKYDVYLTYMFNELAPIIEDEEYGFISADGEEVIAPEFDDALPFVNNITIVKDRDFVFIDSKGERVGTTKLEYVPINRIMYEYKGHDLELIESDYLDVSYVAETVFENVKIENDTLYAYGITKNNDIRDIFQEYRISAENLSETANEIPIVEDEEITKDITVSAFLKFNKKCKKELVQKVQSSESWYHYYETTGYEIDTLAKPNKIQYHISCTGKAANKQLKIVKALDRQAQDHGFVPKQNIMEDEFDENADLTEFIYSYNDVDIMKFEITNFGSIIITCYFF